MMIHIPIIIKFTADLFGRSANMPTFGGYSVSYSCMKKVRTTEVLVFMARP